MKVDSHINFHLYHYAGNNPIRYVDPDGRQDDYFDYDNYFQGRLYGELNGMGATFQNFFGELGNFFVNLFKGNGTVESYYGISVSFGKFEYAATMYVNSSASTISFEFTNLTEELSNVLQSSLGLPVIINSNGVTTDIPLGDYYAAAVSIPVSCSKEGNTASLTLGLKGSIKSPVKDTVTASGTTGLKITASVQDGPCGTIKNRKSDSLNQKVSTYLYYTSTNFLMENIE